MWQNVDITVGIDSSGKYSIVSIMVPQTTGKGKGNVNN